MNEDLDLTVVLKDCPKGTKFYSSTFGNVEFLRIDKDDFINPIVIKWIKEEGNSYIEYLSKDGKFRGLGECIIFPSKDQRDWSKWQRPFKDGDVVTYKLKGSLVAFIYKERTTTTLVKSHFALYIHNMGFCIDGDIALKEEEIVFATEEEKLKLFQAIKDNGYKWNEETKTLEKLIVPKFKVGDIIRKKDGTKECVITKIHGDLYDYVTSKKFKTLYFIKCEGGYFPIDRQDDYELVPNKFDPKTLQPFDKVLVRDYYEKTWIAAFFSHISDLTSFFNKFVTVAGRSYKQMIPYNEETNHLLGTNNEAPEYYKCWED